MESSLNVRVSKQLLIIFTAVYIFLGINFGFVKIVPKKWRMFAKFFSYFCAFTVLMMVFFQVFMYSNNLLFIHLWCTLEFNVYLIILLTSKYTFYDYMLHYSSIDASLMLDSNSLRGPMLMALILPTTSCVFKMIVSILFCLATNNYSHYDQCKIPPPEMIKSLIIVLTMDAIVLIQFVMMYTCYKRVKILKSKLGNRELKIISAVKIYKNIFDGIDTMKPFIDKMILTSLLFGTPKHMIIIYMALHQLKVNNDWMSFAMQYAVLLNISLLSILPAIAAELVNSEVDKIKLILHNYLTETTDKLKRTELKDALRYINGRPSQYYVWRRIPVDLRLIGFISSLVSTYIIVIIQFTHLYD